MKRPGAFTALCALLLGAFPASPAPAAGDPAPAWSLDNPFCDVLAAVVPAEKPEEYGLALYARGGTKVEAHVTLIGDKSAYDAHVPATNLKGDLTDRYTDAVFVRFAEPTPLRYFFVDSYSIDGAAPVTCPSYVFRSGSGPNDDRMQGLGLQVVTPAVLQDLPALPCGKIYTEPGIRKDFQPLVGHYGDTPRDVTMHVYIDSNGNRVRVALDKSSGVDGLDEAALGDVQYTRYTPATLLCTPVVGELEMTLEYKP